jgi:hypothetical protein
VQHREPFDRSAIDLAPCVDDPAPCVAGSEPRVSPTAIGPIAAKLGTCVVADTPDTASETNFKRKRVHDGVHPRVRGLGGGFTPEQGKSVVEVARNLDFGENMLREGRPMVDALGHRAIGAPSRMNEPDNPQLRTRHSRGSPIGASK